MALNKWKKEFKTKNSYELFINTTKTSTKILVSLMHERRDLISLELDRWHLINRQSEFLYQELYISISELLPHIDKKQRREITEIRERILEIVKELEDFSFVYASVKNNNASSLPMSLRGKIDKARNMFEVETVEEYVDKIKKPFNDMNSLFERFISSLR